MKNRYKVAALILSIIFLVFLPHSNLLNEFEKAFSEQTILQKNIFSKKKEAVKKKDHSKERAALLV